jgi:hypothetical protein
MLLRPWIAVSFAAAAALAQEAAPEAPKAAEYTIPPGTKIPLTLINTISTKGTQEGDTVYLKTAFPIVADGRIVIPVPSYVSGTVTHVVKPGRATGKGELYVRFDSLTLPNGVTREFRARLSGVDGQNSGKLDRSEGKVTSDANKGGDVRTVSEGAGVGASIGMIVGSAAGRTGMGAGLGAGAGAAAGLITVLSTRGPDAVLASGSTVEMVLDRSVSFSESELNFNGSPGAGPSPAEEAPKPHGTSTARKPWPR